MIQVFKVLLQRKIKAHIFRFYEVLETRTRVLGK